MQGRESFRSLVERAGAPALAPGAAERIADGAWERAVALGGAAGRGAAAGFRRRALQLAAAAVVLAAAVISFRSSTPAFAVEGDSVQVRRGDAWTTSREVPVGSWVYVPQGARTSVHGADGARVAPQPGALFRILAADQRRTWRVELHSGDAEVSGDAVTLRVSDALEVARAESDDVLRVVGSFGCALDAAPARIEDTAGAAGMTPWVRSVDGVARVVDLRGPDVLLLRPAEVAVQLTFGSAGRLETRLARETKWSADVPADVLLGERVAGAYPRIAGGFTLALGSPDTGVRTISISGEFCEEALNQLALVAAQRAAFVGTAAARPVMFVAPPRIVTASPTTAEYEYERAGRRTLIIVRADGSARLEGASEAPREFASLAALRRAAPAAAALFGDRLR